MRGMRVARVGAGSHACQAHYPHEPLHTLAIHGIADAIQIHGYPSAPVKRSSSILVINVSHQFQCLRTLLNRVVIPIGSSEAQQLTLSSNAEVRMPRHNPLPFALN